MLQGIMQAAVDRVRVNTRRFVGERIIAKAGDFKAHSLVTMKSLWWPKMRKYGETLVWLVQLSEKITYDHKHW